MVDTVDILSGSRGKCQKKSDSYIGYRETGLPNLPYLPTASARSLHARPSPADKLRDLAEHVGDPWMARQLADIAADLDRPRRPGRPEGRSTVVRRRDAILCQVRALPVYRALSGEAAARSMHRDFARWLRFRDSSARPHASPAAEWCELANDLGFIELPAIKTLKNIFARD